MVRPSRRRSLVAWLRRAYQVSERRVCGVTGFARSSQRYRSTADPQDELRLRLKELAAARVRYGYRRLHVLLRREGWPINAKRVSRLYNEEGLSIRPKTPRRRRSTRYRAGRPEIERPNDCWAMDFMSDSLFDGRAFRILTIVDCHSRESLATVPRPSFRAHQVVEILNGLIRTRGKPHAIRCDNGPEFAGRVLDQWAYWHGVELDFSRPGKPTDNAYIEAFNARLRAECLNASWFLSMNDARDRIESWRHDYNTARPHSALGNLTPRAFARQAHEARKIA